MINEKIKTVIIDIAEARRYIEQREIGSVLNYMVEYIELLEKEIEKLKEVKE